MTTLLIKVENLKCRGCANTIARGLRKLESVEHVRVEVKDSLVEIVFNGNENNVDEFENKLKQMGYPSVSMQNDTFLKAKSYLSCAMGRISLPENL
jgi:copper chaperone CopZ